MRWEVKSRGKNWKPWFAWFPVQVLDYNQETKELRFFWVWLESVYMSEFQMKDGGTVYRDYSFFPYPRTHSQ